MREANLYRSGVRGRWITTCPGVGSLTHKAHLQCGGCGLVGSRVLSTTLQSEQIDKKFLQIGWSIDPHLCPSCRTSKSQHPINERSDRDYDWLGGFLAECTERVKGDRVQSSKLYALFVAWSRNSDGPEWTQVRFSRVMKERGHAKLESNGIRWLDLRMTRSAREFHGKLVPLLNGDDKPLPRRLDHNEGITMTTKPTQAAIKAQVLVFRLLSEHFDEDKGAYSNGWSDQKIASDCGLACDAVIELRRAGFGELKEPAEITALRADIRSLEQLHREHADTITKEIAALRGRIMKVPGVQA